MLLPVVSARDGAARFAVEEAELSKKLHSSSRLTQFRQDGCSSPHYGVGVSGVEAAGQAVVSYLDLSSFTILAASPGLDG